MNVKTFRARSIQEALALVRRDLGPDAAVLHTREVTAGVSRWLGGGRQIEVLATSDEVDIPIRIPLATEEPDDHEQFRARLAASARQGLELNSASPTNPRWQPLLQALLDAGWEEHAARQMVASAIKDRTRDATDQK